jgi:hypothetical protein
MKIFSFQRLSLVLALARVVFRHMPRPILFGPAASTPLAAVARHPAAELD